jgi:hypothetical protein
MTQQGGIVFTRGFVLIIGRRTSSPEREKGPDATPRPFLGVKYRTGKCDVCFTSSNVAFPTPELALDPLAALPSFGFLAFGQITFSAFSFPGRAC